MVHCLLVNHRRRGSSLREPPHQVSRRRRVALNPKPQRLHPEPSTSEVLQHVRVRMVTDPSCGTEKAGSQA